VVSVEDEVIPPRNEAVMKSRVISGIKYKEGILVPLKLFVHTHGLAIEHVLVKPGDGIFYGRVFNTGNIEIFVKKNTEIALFTPVKDVVESLTHQDVTVCNVHVSVGNGSAELPEFCVTCFEKDAKTCPLNKQVNLKHFY
jgi:hypothetical protein